MYRYFLHHMTDWPIAGSCNPEPFGPDSNGMYLVTMDASHPMCLAMELDFVELTIAAARTWSSSLPPAEDVPDELRPWLYGDEPPEVE